jgi:hypothetical protein
MLIAIGFAFIYFIPPLIGMESPSHQIEEITITENIVSEEPINKKYAFLRLYGSCLVTLILNHSTVFNESFVNLMQGFFAFDIIAMLILP